jgi:proteic killer suppression protein
MIIIFANNRLKKYANDHRLAKKKMGIVRARLFLQRLDDLASATSFADLPSLPGHFHPLKENRKGQWACDLDQPFRLIFKPIVSSDDDRKHQHWHEWQSLTVIEIIDYH